MTDPIVKARTVRFLGSSMVPVPLADPLEVDGAVFNEVQVAKLTVRDYRQHADAGRRTEVLSLPMYYDASDTPLPDDVLDALSFRDAQNVMEVASGFLNAPPKAGAETSASA